MATFNGTAVAGGTVAGGLFNLSDAALIALTLSDQPGATKADLLLFAGGGIATPPITEGQLFPQADGN